MWGGIIVAGPATVTFAPMVFRRWMFDLTTLEWVMSPQIRMSRPSKPPFFSLIVIASRRACVGCSCAPSPALMTDPFT